MGRSVSSLEEMSRVSTKDRPTRKTRLSKTSEEGSLGMRANDEREESRRVDQAFPTASATLKSAPAPERRISGKASTALTADSGLDA